MQSGHNREECRLPPPLMAAYCNQSDVNKLVWKTVNKTAIDQKWDCLGMSIWQALQRQTGSLKQLSRSLSCDRSDVYRWVKWESTSSHTRYKV